jgi:hypothetical protein
MKEYHYTYRISFPTGHVYFGVRSCSCLPEEDSYLGSPATFKHYWEEHEPTKTILACWPTREIAEAIEDELILYQWSLDKSLSLNASVNGTKFNRYGTKHSEEFIANRSKKWEFVDPEGKVIEVFNLEKFCRDKDLDPSNMRSVNKGRDSVHKGYRQVNENTIGVPFVKVNAGSKVFKLKSPSGEMIEGINISAFAREHGLIPGNLHQVIRGERLSHRGYTLPNHRTALSRAKPFQLVSPLGEVINDTNLAAFAGKNNLNNSNLNAVIRGKVLHYKGYTANLENHSLYLAAKETRGISKRDPGYIVSWTEEKTRKAKYFRAKEKAIELRDKLEKEGYEFAVNVPNWKEKLDGQEDK